MLLQQYTLVGVIIELQILLKLDCFYTLEEKTETADGPRFVMKIIMLRKMYCLHLKFCDHICFLQKQERSTNCEFKLVLFLSSLNV